MYTVVGIRPDGSQCEPLGFSTLTDALKKLQDLIEADELEIQAGQEAMFVRYTVVPAINAGMPMRQPSPSSPTPPTDSPKLRLVR